MGRFKSLDSLESFLCYTPQLRILYQDTGIRIRILDKDPVTARTLYFHTLEFPQAVAAVRQLLSSSLSHVRHSATLWTVAPGPLCPRNSLGQDTRAGGCSLLQGIFPTQGSNPDLPHCRWILYHLSPQGSPRILERVAFPSLADLPDPGIEPSSPELQADSLPSEPPGEPLPAAGLQVFFSALRFLGADWLMSKGCNCWRPWHPLFADTAGNIPFLTATVQSHESDWL